MPGTYTLGVCYDRLSGFVGQMSKLGIFRIIVHENKIVLSVKSHNIHFLPPAINDIVRNHGLFTLTFFILHADRAFCHYLLDVAAHTGPV